MKQVAPTLTFIVYPEEQKRNWTFDKVTCFGYSSFANFGRCEPFGNKKPYLIEVNKFIIAKNSEYITKANLTPYYFNMNLSLSKWFYSRLRDVSLAKINIQTGFGSNDIFHADWFEMEMEYKIKYGDNIGDPGIKDEETGKVYNILTIDCCESIPLISTKPSESNLVKLYRYFECLTFLKAPALVNVQLYKWE